MKLSSAAKPTVNGNLLIAISQKEILAGAYLQLSSIVITL